MRNVSLVFLLFVTWASAVHSQGESDATGALKQILADWTHRRERTESVLYEVDGKTTFVKGAFNDSPDIPRGKEDLPAQDYVFPLKMKWLLNFRKNWVLKECFEETFFEGKSWIPIHSTIYFDGTELKVFEPKPALGSGAPQLTIQTQHFAHLVFSPLDGPVFFAHGILKSAKVLPRPQSLVVPVEPDQFRLHGVGALNGTKHLVVRTLSKKSRFYEYWVDPGREGFVTRCVMYSDDRVFTQVDVWPQKTAWGWLPKRWDVSTYLRGAEVPDRLEQLAVRTVTVNPSTTIEQFQIAASPGAIVRDARSERVYEVRRTPWWSYLLLASFLVALVVAWIVYRRKRYVSGPSAS
jgi:hypothetical protein